jgi:hypothetical protein
MLDPAISPARLHNPARLGRSGTTAAGGAGLRRAAASPHRSLTDAASIAESPARRPRRTSLRPGADDLTGSSIEAIGVAEHRELDDVAAEEERGRPVGDDA